MRFFRAVLLLGGLLVAVGGSDLVRVQSHEARVTDQPDRPVLVFNHNPKAGGGTVLKVLRALTPCEFVHHHNSHLPWWENPSRRESCFVYVRESRSTGAQDRTKGGFVIGGVREPCDHFVSLWAFGSAGKGALRKMTQNQTLGLYGRDPPTFDSPRDLEAFREWLRHPMIEGIIQKRFDGSYVEGSHKTTHVDCWVRVEDEVRTLLACLRQFERRGGRLDWTSAEAKKLLHAAEAPRGAPKEVETYSGRLLVSKNGVVDVRLGHHAPCATYFQNASDAQFVEDRQARIYADFGYAGCCR